MAKTPGGPLAHYAAESRTQSSEARTVPAWKVRPKKRPAMSKPFDATMRKLIELDPAAWLRDLAPAGR